MSDIFTNSQFWIALIAFSALIVSLLPYMGRFFKGKIGLDIYSRIWITHAVGNPNISLHMIIRNIGKGELRIKKITAVIIRDGIKVIELPAQNYVAEPKDNQNVLFTKLYLKPNQEWSHVVNFLQIFDREEGRNYKKAELTLRNEINRLLKLREEGDNEPVRVDDTIVQPFYDIFDKKFIWTAENYTIEVLIETDNKKVDISKKYRFTIFEVITEDLMEIKNEYPTGAGIFFNPSTHVGAWIELEEIE